MTEIEQLRTELAELRTRVEALEADEYEIRDGELRLRDGSTINVAADIQAGIESAMAAITGQPRQGRTVMTPRDILLALVGAGFVRYDNDMTDPFGPDFHITRSGMMALSILRRLDGQREEEMSELRAELIRIMASR